jgi:sec-independent protein translocase protein TatB
MFNIGGGEILVILLVALIVLGPQRLPEAARKLGSVIGEVRRMATGFQSEIKTAFEDAELATKGEDGSADRLASRPSPNKKQPSAPQMRRVPTSTATPEAVAPRATAGELPSATEPVPDPGPAASSSVAPDPASPPPPSADPPPNGGESDAVA